MTRPAQRPGRPRSLSMDAIVRAALELGLDQLNMKELAAALGVNVVTLYRHVRSRDEILRIAAFQLMLTRRLPQGGGEHWLDIARRYAQTLFDLFVSHPALIAEVLRGNVRPRSEIDVLEQFLQAIAVHGFSAAEGVRLHRGIGHLVLGAATGVISMDASHAQGMPWEQDLRQALAEREPRELPAVRESLPAFMDFDRQQWRFALEALLAGFALARGELPATPPAGKPAGRSKAARPPGGTRRSRPK